MTAVGQNVSALSELVQQAEQLTAVVDSAGQLPRVERNLRQLAEAGQQLWSRTAAQTGGQDVRAAILLGARGVDVPAMTQRLQTLDTSVEQGGAAAGAAAAAGGGAVVRGEGTDVAGFLRSERESAVLAVIERGRLDTWQYVDQMHWDGFQQRWRQYKQSVLEQLSVAAAAAGDEAAGSAANRSFAADGGQDAFGSALNASRWEASLRGETSAPPAAASTAGSSLTAVETAYAEQVRQLVERASALDAGGGKQLRLLQLCQRAVADNQLDSSTVGEELWSAVAALANLCVSSSDSTATPAALLDRHSPAMQSALVDSALQLLQSEQLQRVRQLVFASLRGARLGGVPSVRQLLHSYLVLRMSHQSPAAGGAGGLLTNDHLLRQQQPVCDGVSAWWLVYECLRCGDATAAREAALASRPPLADVARWLQERAASGDGAVSSASDTALRLAYRRATSGAGGAASCNHERAVLAVLGGCGSGDCDAFTGELFCDSSAAPTAAGAAVGGGRGAALLPHAARTTSVATTTDDFLWLRLACVRAQTSTAAQTTALAQLQRQLRQHYGETHFDAHNQPLLYFRVLLLSGQLEAAVEFLSRVESLRPHAVHIGLSLHEACLLQLADSVHAPVLTTVAPSGGTSSSSVTDAACHRINLVRCTLSYTRRFEQHDALTALHYLALMRQLRCYSPSGQQQQQLVARAVADLVRASGQLHLLLGSVSGEGVREPGAIERLQLEADRVRLLVAAECEQRGQLEEAAQLHDLAGNHQRQLQLLCRLLSEVVAQPAGDSAGGGDDRRTRLIDMAAGVANRFRQLGELSDLHPAPSEHDQLQQQRAGVDTLHLLLDLATFFQLFHSGRADDALHVMQQLQLVSLASEQLETRVQACQQLHPEVRRLLPDILLATMSALQTQAAAGGASGGDANAAQYWRLQARALLTYAGTVPYRLPGDTHARLTRMEALMN